MHSVEERIARVVGVFQYGRAQDELFKDSVELERALVNTDALFISVSFEGAAAGLAYRQLQAGATRIDVPDWPAHAAQVHIGIGWALAELSLRPDAYLSQFTGVMQGRVLDGFGYYSGLFRRRRCIQAMDIPEGIPAQLLTAFDQGLGRAMWYISKGEIEPLMNMVGPFPKERKAGIWRGIGVAATYVGGLDDVGFERLDLMARSSSPDFVVGVLLSAAGRITAGTDTGEVLGHLTSLGRTTDDVRMTIAVLSDSADYAAALKAIGKLASAHRP